MKTSWVVTNLTRQAPLATHAQAACTMASRVIGLLGRTGLAAGEGLWIKPCNSIHSLGMRFAFDALFLDKELRVVHLIESMAPWRVSSLVWKANSVLELPAGTIAQTGTQLTDQLSITPSCQT